MIKMPNQRRASSNPFIVEKDDIEMLERNKNLEDTSNGLGYNVEYYKESFAKTIFRLLLSALGLLIIPTLLIYYFAFGMPR